MDIDVSFHIGIALLEFQIPAVHSLKEKRGVIKRLKSSIQSQFQCTVSEVGQHDKWQRSVLAVALISTDGPELQGMLQRVVQYAERQGFVELMGSQLEISAW